MKVTALIVAKAPVPGLAKTRLAKTLGDDIAADIAAAALLDTLDAVSAADFDERIVAMTGDLTQASRQEEITAALASYIVIPQRGNGFAERLRYAHEDAAASGNPVFQIGMDTPQVTAALLNEAATQLTERGRSVLGLAEDGGWWGLGIGDPSLAHGLVEVTMSSPTTGADTRRALEARGAVIASLPILRDVDHASDLDIVAAQCLRSSRFHRVVRQVVHLQKGSRYPSVTNP